jgi:hypothetical protein
MTLTDAGSIWSRGCAIDDDCLSAYLRNESLAHRVFESPGGSLSLQGMLEYPTLFYIMYKYWVLP